MKKKAQEKAIQKLKRTAEGAQRALEEARAKVKDWTLEELEEFRDGALSEDWEDLQDEEAFLIEAIKDVFREAGATEAQIAWGKFENVQVGFKGQLRLAKLFHQKDELKLRAIPVMTMACACNERIAELAG